MLSNGGACLRNEVLLLVCNGLKDDGRSQRVDGLICTFGFLKSFIGSNLIRPNINLEVFLGPVQTDKTYHTRPHSVIGPNDVGLSRYHDPIISGLKNTPIYDPLLQQGDVNPKRSRSKAGVD